MSVVDAILRLIDSIGNWFGLLIQRITNIRDGLLNILSYIGSIFTTLWYGLTSLLSSLSSLINEVLEGEVLVRVGEAFGNISGYIGGPATIFIASLMLIVMFRIVVAFVFKILRLNVDYNTFRTERKEKQQSDRISAFQKEHKEF